MKRLQMERPDVLDVLLWLFLDNGSYSVVGNFCFLAKDGEFELHHGQWPSEWLVANADTRMEVAA